MCRMSCAQSSAHMHMSLWVADVWLFVPVVLCSLFVLCANMISFAGVFPLSFFSYVSSFAVPYPTCVYIYLSIHWYCSYALDGY